MAATAPKPAREVLRQTRQAVAAAAAKETKRKVQKSFSEVNLRARIYNPLAIFKSTIGGKTHEPVMETMLVNRNNKHIERWQNMKHPPPYFNRAEVDAGICGGEDSEHHFMRKAAKLGLSKPIQRIIRSFDKIRDECDATVSRSLNWGKKSVPDKWWPVGIKGGFTHRGQFVDSSPLEECCTNYNDNKAVSIVWMARNAFKLSEEAVDRIINKKTSLLYEVSSVCYRWEEERKSLPTPDYVPFAYLPFLTMIGPQERFLEVKEGVYYMLEKGTVIKFMTKPSFLSYFVLESAFGFGIQKEHRDRLKGTVGVIDMCPAGFCLEMEFSGMSLQDVINGDLNCEVNRPCGVPSAITVPMPVSTPSVVPRTPGRGYYGGVAKPVLSQQPELLQHHMTPSRMRGILYSVRMLQVTGSLPRQCQEKCKIPIADSFSAVGVANKMREKMLKELPFVIIEIANIVTRMSQQGLVNPDIKSDNIVIDGVTGQPKMIDFGLVIPSGNRDRARSDKTNEDLMINKYPQTAPEYLKGETCREPSMVYGLSYLIFMMLLNISTRTADMSVASMRNNLHLSGLMARAYSHDPEKRPRASEFAPVVGSIFPFNKEIARLFRHPMHTLR